MSVTLRALVAGLSVCLGAASLWTAHGLDASVDEQVALAEEAGVHSPELSVRLRRAESPVRGRLRLAWALLTTARSPESPGRARRLAGAEELARSVLAVHPASWGAATVAGAAAYLRWSETEDPRLVQEYQRWERPLLFALRRAPDRQPPVRYLAAAYLELWPALSPEKRTLARGLAAEAFSDRATFSRLVDRWLEVADPAVALEAIPDRSWAWAAIRSRAGGNADWDAFCAVWERERTARIRELRRDLAEAARLSAGGELGRARRTLLGVLKAAPVGETAAGLVQRSLALLPHAPRRSEPSAAAARWLEWAMDRQLVTGRQPLPPATLARLRSLAFPDPAASATAAATSAWVDLVRGRGERAAQAAAREDAWRAEWAPYHVLAARHHLGHKDPDRARRSLERVHPEWRRHPAYHALVEELTGPEPDTRAGESATAGTGELAAPTRAASPLDWRYSGAVARLPLGAREAAGGLSVSLGDAPPQGAALQVRWDGRSLGCLALAAGAPRLDLTLEVTPGLHELVLEPLSAGRVYPGSVALTPRHRSAPPG